MDDGEERQAAARRDPAPYLFRDGDAPQGRAPRVPPRPVAAGFGFEPK